MHPRERSNDLFTSNLSEKQTLSEKVAAKTPQGKDLDSCTNTEIAQEPGHVKIQRNAFPRNWFNRNKRSKAYEKLPRGNTVAGEKAQKQVCDKSVVLRWSP